ncbi:MAG TPA: hypothetical protein DGX96_04480 [Lachnospiraceae bacterium]|jgi:hypothetical protein|nr:hypothetical protein [Lachnospiraceae bacterium]
MQIFLSLVFLTGMEVTMTETRTFFFDFSSESCNERTRLAALEKFLTNLHGHMLSIPVLMHQDTRKRLTDEIPYTNVLDFSITVIRVQPVADDERLRAIYLKRNVLENFQIPWKNYLNHAVSESMAKAPLLCESICDLYPQDIPRDHEGMKTFVISNELRLFGASAILYPGALALAAERMGGSFCLIPSSVHEWFLTPLRNASFSMLKWMLADGNRNVLDSQDDLLSNEILCYDSEGQSLYWWKDSHTFETVDFGVDLT